MFVCPQLERNHCANLQIYIHICYDKELNGIVFKIRVHKVVSTGREYYILKEIFRNNSLFPTWPRQAMVSPVCHIRSQYPVLRLRGRTLTLMVLVCYPAAKISIKNSKLNIPFEYKLSLHYWKALREIY